jgi:hypothetical protein
MRSPLALALLAGALAACSTYHLVRYTGALGSVHRIAIKPLGNHSYEPGADAMMSDALLREFQRRGDVDIVANPNDADLVLSGSVLPFGTGARSFSSVAFALEYEVSMSIDLQAKQRDGKSIHFGPGVLRASELYLASSDVEVLRKNREEAIRRVSVLLASRVHDALAEKLTAPVEPEAPAAPAKGAAPSTQPSAPESNPPPEPSEPKVLP